MGRVKSLTRLAAMPAKKRLAVLIAIAAIAAAVAGCGSDEIKGTIPASNAAQLRSDLDAARSRKRERRLHGAKARVQDFVEHVDLLPATSGTALKEALRDAGDNLEQLVQEPCGSGATGAAGEQPTSSTTKEATATDTTATTGTTSNSSTSTTVPSEEPPSPPGGGSGNGLGNGNAGGNGQSNGNPGNGNPGGGGSTGGTGGTGGTGVGGG